MEKAGHGQNEARDPDHGMQARESTLAEPLKNHYGTDIPARIAAMIRAVHPAFPAKRFLASAQAGYEDLNLMARGKHIARALGAHLPQDFAIATDILLESLDTPPAALAAGGGMSSFLYLPHTLFVSTFGLGHFEASMRAQYVLTQRFTAEFSMRPFLEQHTEATLERLRNWANDPNEHVRRLVSEATRPRLPWAPRLRRFQEDPRPVLALLDLLKDDPALYVRRSVANNLNDIGKDNPELLYATMRRWQRKSTPQRDWLINHALRSAIKRGETPALEILGFAAKATVSIDGARITPARATVGGTVTIALDLRNSGRKPQSLMVDFRIHYVKASGKTSPKVFKLKRVDLAPGETVRLAKSVSLQEMSTRKHYPGKHRVDLLLNGEAFPVGTFSLRP